MRPPPEICPQCGAEVPRKALACPECGSDYETGWSEDADAQRLGLPNDEFDYDEFVKEEFSDGRDGASRGPRPRGIGIGWWLVAIAVILALLFLLLAR